MRAEHERARSHARLTDLLRRLGGFRRFGAERRRERVERLLLRHVGSERGVCECASEQLGKRVWSDGRWAQGRRRRALARARGLQGSAQLGPAVAAHAEGCAQVQVARGVAHTAARGGFTRSGDAENGEAE